MHQDPTFKVKVRFRTQTPLEARAFGARWSGRLLYFIGLLLQNLLTALKRYVTFAFLFILSSGIVTVEVSTLIKLDKTYILKIMTLICWSVILKIS